MKVHLIIDVAIDGKLVDRIQQNEPCDRHGKSIDFALSSIDCLDGARDSSVSFYPLGACKSARQLFESVVAH